MMEECWTDAKFIFNLIEFHERQPNFMNRYFLGLLLSGCRRREFPRKCCNCYFLQFVSEFLFIEWVRDAHIWNGFSAAPALKLRAFVCRECRASNESANCHTVKPSTTETMSLRNANATVRAWNHYRRQLACTNGRVHTRRVILCRDNHFDPIAVSATYSSTASIEQCDTMQCERIKLILLNWNWTWCDVVLPAYHMLFRFVLRRNY